MAIGNSMHRNAGEFLSRVLTKDLAISTTETEVKYGTDILEERRKIILINDSSFLIYVSHLPTFTIGGVSCFTVYSGSILEIMVDPNPPDGVDPIRAYVKVEEGSTTIKMVEAR